MRAASESSSSRDAGAVRDRGLSTLLGLVLPVIVILATSVLVFTWRGELPEPVASHWGGGGVDRTAPLTTLVLIVAGAAVLCAVGGWMLAYYKGQAAETRRAGVAFSLGQCVFLSGMMFGTLTIQRGLAVATDAPATTWVVIGSLATGTLAAAMGALAMPPDPPAPPVGGCRVSGGARRPDPRLPWVREVRSRETALLSALSVLAIVGVGVLSGSLLILVPAAAVVGLIMFPLARVTVTIDADGLRARGLLGWPRLSVPAEEILEVHAAWVSPVQEFGGLGYRISGGDDIGLVVRSGEGLRVTCTGLRAICVSVDDSRQAAEVLRGVARAAIATNPPE